MLLHTSSPVEKCINQERESGSQRRAAAHHFPAKLSPSKTRGKRIERARSAREILVYIYNRGGGSRFQGARPVPPSVEQGLRIEVRTFMPLQMVSRALLKRFWLPKWVPNRGPEDAQTGFLGSISLRTRQTWFLKALSLYYQHCEDAI